MSSKIARALIKNYHYQVDEKSRFAYLTRFGEEFCEKALLLKDLFYTSTSWFYYIKNALLAKEIFLEDQEYIICLNKAGKQEIIIIDESTGRAMKSMRWQEGLHQAIEAKHDLWIQPEPTPLASISYQSFFLLYPKLSGMTGTAQTECKEFQDVYDLNVVIIPTNKPFKRKDLPTVTYLTSYAKWRRIAEESFVYAKIGRPVLIGTRSIKASEIIAFMIKLNNVNFTGYFKKFFYQLLNARPENSKRESEIIAGAGRSRATTIATNMAGRGTDILLGGTFIKATKKILSLSQITYANIQNFSSFFSRKFEILSVVVE